MKVVFLQGNPGIEYKTTRHNAAWIVSDAIFSESDWKKQPKFKCEIAEWKNDVIFVKPQTFYNETGQSISAIKKFYKLSNEDILTIHDDVDLDFGTVRTRKSGSGGGNNGIKSINSHIGEDYFRIRIGVRNELFSRMDRVKFVLGKFSKDEINILENDIKNIALKCIEDFSNDKLTETTEKI